MWRLAVRSGKRGVLFSAEFLVHMMVTYLSDFNTTRVYESVMAAYAQHLRSRDLFLASVKQSGGTVCATDPESEREFRQVVLSGRLLSRTHVLQRTIDCIIDTCVRKQCEDLSQGMHLLQLCCPYSDFCTCVFE